MSVPPLQYLRKHLAASIGWIVFAGLLCALLLGRYVFNPFIFGFGYYVIYALVHLRKREDPTNAALLERRLIAVSVIALLYLWIALRGEVDRHSFIAHFERTCYHDAFATEVSRKVCEEIQAHVDSYLQREATFDDE